MTTQWKWAVAIVASCVFAMPSPAGEPPQKGRLKVLASGGLGIVRLACVPSLPDEGPTTVWTGMSDEIPALEPGLYDVVAYSDDQATVRSLVEIRAGITATVRLSLSPPQGGCDPPRVLVE